MSAPGAHDPPTAGPTDDPPRAGSVTTIRWPQEVDAREAAAAAGRPRLLVVGRSDPPPLVWDEREDWIREDAGAAERQARAERLCRAGVGGGSAPRPVLDADGILHATDGRVVVVPPIEAALLAALLHRTGHVVRREDLHRAAWPGGGGDGRAVDGRIRDLRRRTADLGIAIHTVRGVGYLLEVGSG